MSDSNGNDAATFNADSEPEQPKPSTGQATHAAATSQASETKQQVAQNRQSESCSRDGGADGANPGSAQHSGFGSTGNGSNREYSQGQQEPAVARNPAPNGGTSERKKRTNPENAQHSTGPKSEQGKRRVRNNALKHGLYARGDAVIRKGPGQENELAFEELLKGFERSWKTPTRCSSITCGP